MKILKSNNKGFTLIEIVGSITILAIILTVSINIFVSTNKTAVSNNEKLVAIHLAKATLERVRENFDHYFIDESNNLKYKNEEFVLINNKEYEVKVSIVGGKTPTKNSLVHVLVEVNLLDAQRPVSSKVEGYVAYDPKND
ncbi:type IV pilus modification PilV family protein [Pallidibacillus pasinlerensis]|uniref:Type II secretion system protein n=1 Tax=Pallidibacillus pasinlerensis TaxID=2703818 RepID=A0ABX0A347_9BACI|nr:type II secretion system protein [Pallidibacillus pasinlerensis]NCU16944.1 type II secretion system protein [Pallidibacillus pasinlerensis]